MPNDNRHKLAQYRIERAAELLEASRLLFDAKHYRDSINRSYYSIFYIMRSLLALDGFDAKKHYGVISEFRKNYIKTNVLDQEFSIYVEGAFEIRNESDYDDMFIASCEDAKEQIEHAQLMLDVVKDYLQGLD